MFWLTIKKFLYHWNGNSILSFMICTLQNRLSWTFDRPILIICWKVDMSYFPFDTQVCYLKFGSWSYWKSLLNLMHTYPSNELKGDVSTLLNATWWRKHDLKSIFRVKLVTLLSMIRHISNQRNGKLSQNKVLFMRSNTIVVLPFTKPRIR